MVADWRLDAIVLVVLGQVGISVSKLQNFELIGVEKKAPFVGR